MPRILIPIADSGFDPTEVAVPWRILTDAGFEVVFATGSGKAGSCDAITLAGPPVFRSMLAPRPEAVACYEQLEVSSAFVDPISYDAIDPDDYDALVLPGGHAPETRGFLESTVLQDCAVAMLDAGKVVGAICHGPLVLARARRADGSCPIEGRRMTALTWAMEMSAWAMTVAVLGSHYRTYPTPVQTEVVLALGRTGRFVSGPLIPSYDKPFVVVDNNLITARWPGDAAAWGEALVAALS
jgi:protease I